MSQNYAEPLQQINRTYVLWRGRKLTYFAGCDYFRLSSHPAVLKAARTCLDKFGLNVAASRKTTGNHRIYGELEAVVRKFFQAEAVVISSTGYFTNIIAAHGLRGGIDAVLIDERAHGSLRDAAFALGCPLIEFEHKDPSALKKKIPASIPRARLALMTDGIFSHDGSVAPLAEYRELLGPDALLWVDDAHAGGVLGKHGRGTVELAGLERANVLQTITFSKAFGTYGGAILCEDRLATRISETSGAVGGNTPPPLPIAYATIASLKRSDSALRRKLFKNIELFWRKYGRPAPRQLSPIVALHPPNHSLLQRKLFAAGIYPPLIKYGGGNAEAYFRFALSSEHTPRQITALAEVLASVEP